VSPHLLLQELVAAPYPQLQCTKKETIMKSRTLISVFTLALAATSGACSSGSQQTADEPTASTEQAQVIMPAVGNIIAWPAGPIAWNGLVGTWPISVWSPATIGGLAFGINGVTNLGVTALGFPGLVAGPITTPFLNAFVPPVGVAGALGAPFFGTAGLIAPAFGFNGAFNPAFTAGFGFGAFAPMGAIQGTFLNGALFPGLGFLTPTLTNSALLFTGLAPLSTFTPFTFNVTFTAQAAAQAAAISTASLSVFATPILPTALATMTTIPFMSMAFPIMPLPFATTGLLAAPIAAAPLL
jgi:hypothetical protein